MLINSNKNQVLLPASVGGEEEVRAQRVWILLDVAFLAWTFFFVYFWFRGYTTASAICQGELLCYLVLQVLYRKKRRFKMVMSTYLMCCGVGIFFIAVTYPSLEKGAFFFPISIMVASYLFGIRQAAYWLVTSLVFFGAFYLYQFGLDETLTTRFDEMLLSMGIALMMFFCCQQAESSLQTQTKNLVDLSRSLQKRSDRLERLATTDSLTGLTNRYQFQLELEETIDCATEQEKVALFLIDMDRFKEINDTLGHVTGDEVLVEVGRRLTKNLNTRATVARLGGDEFCVLFANMDDVEKADDIAQEIVELLNARYRLSEVEVTLGTSVGYSICPDHAGTAEQMLSYADTAMYHAKNNKQDVALYQPEMTERLSVNRVMNEQLGVALEADEFYLVYQPQFDSQSGETIGVEALLRWCHDGQTVMPGRFVPLLENTGQIIPVSHWLVREVCRQQDAWKKMGHDLVVAVNVSPLQFTDDGFVDSIINSLTEFGVPASKLELEITERILIDNVDQVVERLVRLKDLGCRISIDDFGTGYSSLAYLRQLPLDKLKIDQTFIREIPESDDGVIASSIIVLADLLDLEVIAEGVETVEQLEFLRQNGCTQVQGFYFCEPVDPDEIVSMVKSQRSDQAGIKAP